MKKEKKVISIIKSKGQPDQVKVVRGKKQEAEQPAPEPAARQRVVRMAVRPVRITPRVGRLR